MKFTHNNKYEIHISKLIETNPLDDGIKVSQQDVLTVSEFIENDNNEIRFSNDSGHYIVYCNNFVEE